METGQLRYFALGLGSGLLALGLYLGKVTPEIYAAGLLAILGIAGADMIKHKNS